MGTPFTVLPRLYNSKICIITVLEETETGQPKKLMQSFIFVTNSSVMKMNTFQFQESCAIFAKELHR